MRLDLTTLFLLSADLGLTGPVPFAELCPLKHLRELDLDGNKLTGPIPEWAPGGWRRTTLYLTSFLVFPSRSRLLHLRRFVHFITAYAPP